MSLLSSPIPSLHNGVSQQSPMVRSSEQAEGVENAWLSLADGTGKRPPTETVARLMNTVPDNALIQTINRDITERFTVIVSEGRIRVFDLNGVEMPVNAPGGWGYIASAENPADDICLTTVADYTFVVNRKMVCQMSSKDAGPAPGYAIWVNRSFGKDGEDITYGPGMAYQYPANPKNIYLTGVYPSFTKLPETALQGSVYQITGNDDSVFRTYYVRRSGGVWDETYKPGLENDIDMSTMPHALVREYDGTFIFAPFSWAPRRVGDEVSNPNPGFIGRPIRKLFIYQNRLALVSDESVLFSCAGDLGNFWRMTVMDYIDSDTIALAATTTQVSILIDAVPFNDGIMLTSDQTQFSLSNGEDGVSATTMAIRPVTNYEVNPRAGMVALGSEAYFCSESSGWASIREYTRIDGDDNTQAADVTAHVPRYIPQGVHRMIPAGDKNALFVLTSGDPSAIYVYQFYWLTASDKAQSAVHRWDLGEDAKVLSGAYMGGLLYLLVGRPGGLFLEKLDLQAGAKAPGFDHQVYLDRRLTVTGVYSPEAQRTVLTLPYRLPRDTLQLVRKDLSLVDPATYEWMSDETVRIPGDETASPLMAGQQYTFRYKFSALYLRRNDGTAITNGRTQVRTFTISYRNTGFFTTKVAPYGVDPRVEEVLPGKLAQFSGKVLGSRDLILNSPAFHTGDYKFSVLGESSVASIELENSSHVASTFIAAEWEAFYWSRARG